MRTTLDLNDTVLKRAKQRAAEDGRSLTSFIEDALRLVMLPRPKSGRHKLRVPRRGLGLKKGLSYDDTSALLDRLEDLDARR